MPCFLDVLGRSALFFFFFEEEQRSGFGGKESEGYSEGLRDGNCVQDVI